MKTLKPYLSALLGKQMREDNRGVYDYRDIQVEVNPVARANGSARVKIGATEVLVGVKMNVDKPFPDTPDEGVLIVNAELSPLANAEYESGPPGPDAIELARVVDRGIRESHAIDFEKLCIRPKEKVWIVFLDIYPINDDGNLFDAASLAAMIALRHAVLPKYDEKADQVLYKELTKEKLPMRVQPLLTTFAKINGSTFIDPTKREEKAMDARLSVATLEDGQISAMQKGGTGTFTQKEILDLIELSIEKGKELRKLLK